MAELASEPVQGRRPWSSKRMFALFVAGLALAVAAICGIGRMVKSANEGPLQDLALRAGCADFVSDGKGYADAYTGRCSIGSEVVTLATFTNARDREDWVSSGQLGLIINKV